MQLTWKPFSYSPWKDFYKIHIIFVCRQPYMRHQVQREDGYSTDEYDGKRDREDDSPINRITDKIAKTQEKIKKQHQ